MLRGGGGGAADALRIYNATVRESHIQRVGELRSNRDKNEVREDLDSIERSADLSEDHDNDNNIINNINNSKNGNGNRNGNVGGEEEGGY